MAPTLCSEVPEMFGAEQLLMNRAADRATFDKLVAMINRFKDYFLSNHQVVYEKSIAGQQSRRHYHAGGKESGLHPESRHVADQRCA
ncbi:MAG: hypothetical protein ACLSA6_09865 [Holdemania massiliensis]